ncbi:MAG TPA: hypothetical protein VMK53_08010 [Gemmatimonadales bacterium]|nr:hypothetical protein [Gemmatimonadales bacterium]
MQLCATFRFAVLIMALTACGGRSDSPSTLTTTRDSTGGILRIRHVGEAPVWTPVEVMTIGSVEEGPASFARIRSILLGHDGGVLVADAGSGVVREFGPDGAYRRDIGRDGSGPAEYREPYSLAWMGDTLAILDPINARVGLFHPDGSWAGQWPSPVITGPSHVRLYPSGDGKLYLIGFGQRGRLFLGHGRAGTADTLTDLPPREGVTTFIRCDWPGNAGMRFYEVPFAPGRLLIPGPDQAFLVADTEQYRIASVTPSGDTLRVLERDTGTPVPITDAEWDERTAGWRKDRAEDATLQCPVSAIPRPGAKPALNDLFLADDGTLWVDRWTAGGRVTEVFSAEGDLLGAFPAIERNRNVVPSARGNRLAVVVDDEDGIPFVRVYELR